MFVNSENYDDINKYYKGTWVKFKEEGDTLFYIERATPARIECHTISKEECCVDLTKEGGYFITFLIPRKTVFQYDNTAVMLSRNPARMWKKGMCANNTSFAMLKEKQWYGADFTITLAEGFVNKPSYLSFDTAKAEFAKDVGFLSAALSPRVSISRVGSVYIDDVLVGKYNTSNNILTTRAIYQEDLAPLFNATFKVLP